MTYFPRLSQHMAHAMIAVVVVWVVAMTIPGCQNGAARKNDDLSGRIIRVVTTTGLIGDAVANVGGERVTVEALMGPGVDPHLYKASEGDVRRLSNADVIFYNGLHLEGAMADVLEQLGAYMPTYAVADGIDPARLLTPPEFKGQHDPHIWFDVTMWIDAVVHVRDALTSMDSTHAEIYTANAARFIDSLHVLHNDILDATARVPAELRVLITAHDAFNYFGRAYGFDVRGLQGISTVAEAGTADVQDLARFIAEQRIPAIFVESSVSPRSIEAVQAAVKARGFAVVIGGSLFSDAMGSPDTPEGTYIGMVRYNINTIVDALLRDPLTMISGQLP